MNTREEKIRMWFDMWLKKTDHGKHDVLRGENKITE